MQRLKCDKPYNLDEARKKQGKPRRKRADSRTTAYELVIRIPKQYQELMGKKKISKTVFALNQRTDLKQQVEDFEAETNDLLTQKLFLSGKTIEGEGDLDFANMPIKLYGRRYIDIRRNSISKETASNEERYLKYAVATIGEITLKDLTSEDVERAVLAVPRLSEEWACEKRRLQEEQRARVFAKTHRKTKPYKPLRIAGPAMQHKVLKFIREMLNDAVDREHIERNVAKKKFLSKNFRDSRPLIDPLMEDEAERFLLCVSRLVLCTIKVALLILFSTGMRPEELLALKVGSFIFSDSDDKDTEVRIVAKLKEGRIVFYTKSDSSMRTVPVDRYTASVVKEWIELKRQYLLELGLKMTDATPLLGESAAVWRYRAFHRQWEQFIKKNDFKDIRPYALRHTYATINLARGENIKSVSTLMGHKDASYTLDLYVGFIPSTTRGFADRYVGRLAPSLIDLPAAA